MRPATFISKAESALALLSILSTCHALLFPSCSRSRYTDREQHHERLAYPALVVHGIRCAVLLSLT